VSLLSIVKDALAEAGGPGIPSTIINNQDPVALKALAMINGIGRDLMKSYMWPGLKFGQYTFNTVANQAAYTLPADFRRFAPMTQWDRTSNWPLMGQSTDSFWGLLKNGFITFGMRFWFRVEGGNLVMAPVPTDVRTMAYDYYMNSWVSNADGDAFNDGFKADTDYPRFMPNKGAEDTMRLGLIYKWKASNGQPYSEDKAAFLASIEADTWDSTSPPMLDVTGIPRSSVTKGLLPDTGYANYGN
jgi:hypothetical protein